jgi:hypothetical protein
MQNTITKQISISNNQYSSFAGTGLQTVPNVLQLQQNFMILKNKRNGLQTRSRERFFFIALRLLR